MAARTNMPTTHIPQAARYVPQPRVRIVDRIFENRTLSRNFPVFAYLEYIKGLTRRGTISQTSETQ